MIVFVIQLKSLVFKKILLTQLLLFILLFSMSLQAETRVIFPSDITNQIEQSIYNTNHVQHYITQHKWVYPKDIRTSGRHVDKIPTNVPTYVTQGNSHHSLTGVHRYPVEEYTNHIDNRIYKQSMGMEPIPTPMDTGEQYGQKYPRFLYVSDIKPDNSLSRQKNKPILYSFQNQGRQRYPNLRYVSDIEPDQRLTNQKAKVIQYSLQKIRKPIRTIYPPLLSPYQMTAPGMLSGTIPCIISPTGIEYDPFRTNYNYGCFNNIFVNQYNPFTGLGLFPGQRGSLDYQ